MGITLKTLAGWRGVSPYWKLPAAEVQNLAHVEAAAIYRAHYWDAIAGDALPAGLDYALFDYGVNSGPAKAVIALQTRLGVAGDGRVGPLTLAACRRADAIGLIGQLCDDRLAFLKTLSTFLSFGRGWTARVAEVRAAALVMASEPASSAPPQPFSPLPRPTPPPTPKPAPAGFWQALIAAILSILSRKV